MTRQEALDFIVAGSMELQESHGWSVEQVRRLLEGLRREDAVERLEELLRS